MNLQSDILGPVILYVSRYLPDSCVLIYIFFVLLFANFVCITFISFLFLLPREK